MVLKPTRPRANRGKRGSAAGDDAGRHAQDRFIAWDVRADRLRRADDNLFAYRRAGYDRQPLPFIDNSSLIAQPAKPSRGTTRTAWRSKDMSRCPRNRRRQSSASSPRLPPKTRITKPSPSCLRYDPRHRLKRSLPRSRNQSRQRSRQRRHKTDGAADAGARAITISRWEFAALLRADRCAPISATCRARSPGALDYF